MTDEEHTEDHVWIRHKRSTEHEANQQWKRILWTVITTIIVGAIMSLFGLIGWAASTYVKMGGAGL